MGAFNINITGVGGHGCDRIAKPGEKLYKRCGRFGCPDCMAHDFVMQLRQRGMLSETGIATSIEVPTADSPLPVGTTHIEEVQGKFYAQMPNSAMFTHWPGSPTSVVDDMLKNERKVGQF